MTTGAESQKTTDDSATSAVNYQCPHCNGKTIVVSDTGISCASCGTWIKKYR